MAYSVYNKEYSISILLDIEGNSRIYKGCEEVGSFDTNYFGKSDGLRHDATFEFVPTNHFTIIQKGEWKGRPIILKYGSKYGTEFTVSQKFNIKVESTFLKKGKRYIRTGKNVLAEILEKLKY